MRPQVADEPQVQALHHFAAEMPRDLFCGGERSKNSLPHASAAEEHPDGDDRCRLQQSAAWGVTLDMVASEEVDRLYQRQGLGSRDDAAALQYLAPGWAFDPKQPGLVR